ncbi:HepT-like ribonuclease domain-containing protein [Aequorivita marina]|uniref:HepT-like ribonuclease domain-containing protein n=1 Tax=Aequorivita marina TaxID=3073654 RepID=UPI0028749151|nr:HepT-like ribonuclease domain-containing protein [Aequorivita sp. S2608]MDS1299500.1 DUF86 domain-containing protein [Aequorivita sp. S2608]
MRKINTGHISDILEHINYVEAFIATSTFNQDNFNDKKTEFAVIRCFEVIGEATKRIDDDFKLKHPKVPWKKMSDFRDVLIHDYEKLMSEMVLKTVRDDLPKLKFQLLEILKNEQ